MTYRIIPCTDRDGFPAFYAEVLNSDLTRIIYATFTYRSRERAELEAKMMVPPTDAINRPSSAFADG